MANAIEVESLTKRFGELTAVDGVSFEVGTAEIFGFLGPNGAGKTTTISMLCTMLRPTSGRARVGGHDVAREPQAVRGAIGIVFQDSTLDERLTARQNLNFHGELYGMEPGDIASRGAEMLDRVGLADRAREPVINYSGGMKRRLEIARGLMHAPSVLFLDEPTIGLDPQTRRSLWGYTQSLRDSEGITIFLTTHYMDEAEACDRIAIIDRGQLVALDTPEGLKSRLGGDVISVAAADNRALAGEIAERFQVNPVLREDAVEFTVDRGEAFIPTLFARLATPIRTVSLRRPTLDDVFVALTGREIRESAADEGDRMRSVMKTGRGGPGGRAMTGGRR